MHAARDTVFLEGLSIKGKHGVQDRERQVEQEFLIDIKASFDANASARTDKLSDTVNYARFRDIARDIVANNSFYLIEKVAALIAEKILEDDRIAIVAITIRKPAVYGDCVPGISITRTRS